MIDELMNESDDRGIRPFKTQLLLNRCRLKIKQLITIIKHKQLEQKHCSQIIMYNKQINRPPFHTKHHFLGTETSAIQTFSRTTS